MTGRFLVVRTIVGLSFLCSSAMIAAGEPLWTLDALTDTTLTVAANDTATVQYKVTNRANKPRKLAMQPIQAVTQSTTGLGICGNPFVLDKGESCTLSLSIDGSKLTAPINGGPVVCDKELKEECSRPLPKDVLHITQGAPITDATITVTGSPLSLSTNGLTGTLTINNTSLIVTATNIMSNFVGTALEGSVTETGNTCVSVAPLGSCTLTYTPGSTVVVSTDFPIKGCNTNTVYASMGIEQGVALSNINITSGSAAGGAGFILTGMALTGATNVTFGGVDATSINVVDSTTVTGVTPAHAVGSVDVVISTPNGSATLTDGFTYEDTAIGQVAYGGYIGCLNGDLNDLVVAKVDNSEGIIWGSTTVNVGAAQSTTDGAANTPLIANAPDQISPNAATVCMDYEIDSQGNTPCESGNACYDDWFLPAGNNDTSSGQLYCLYSNAAAIPGGFASDYYWSSTQLTAIRSYIVNFVNGGSGVPQKYQLRHVRCVRALG